MKSGYKILLGAEFVCDRGDGTSIVIENTPFGKTDRIIKNSSIHELSEFAPEKKYNVKVPGIFKMDHYYWRRTICELMDSGLRGGNHEPYQQWTLAQIKKYGLEGCERQEVQDDTE